MSELLTSKDHKKFSITFLLCLVICLLSADQNLLAPNLSAIAKHFNFTDIEKDEKLGGEIALGFFIIGGLFAVIIGHLADTTNRCALLGVIVILGELSCLCTYFISTYRGLFICRILTGISIGGASPIIFSLFGDLYSGETRTYVAAIYSVSASIGVAIGQLISSYLGQIYGWRLPFLVVPLPAIILGSVVLVCVEEPSREHMQDLTDSLQGKKLHTRVDSRQSWSIYRKYVKLFQRKTALLCYLQGIVGCIPWSIISVFLNDFLVADLGYSPIQSTGFLMILGLGGLMGQIAGGWIGQTIYNRDKRLVSLLMGSTTILSVLPLYCILHLKRTSEIGVIAVIGALYPALWFWILGLTAAITGPNVRSILQNVSLPETRGAAFALFNLADDIGKGGGPVLVAYLVRIYGNRKPAFTVGTFAWIICGGLLFSMYSTILIDESFVNNGKIHSEKSTDTFPMMHIS